MILAWPLGPLLLGLVLLLAFLPNRAKWHANALLGFLWIGLSNPLILGLLLSGYLGLVAYRQKWHRMGYVLPVGLALASIGLPIQVEGFLNPLHAWVLLPWNLQRLIHLYMEEGRGKMKTATLEGWWWYLFGLPFVLGSIEWFHDFWTPVRKRQAKLQGRLALEHGFRALWQSWAAISIHYLLPWESLRHFQPENANPLGWLLILAAIGSSFVLGVAGVFSYARCLAAICGVRLTRRLFGRLWLARSVVEFWSNWNIPNIVFVREYFFLPLMRLSSHYAFWISLVFVLCLWLQQGWWHGSPQWAILNLTAILIQTGFTTLKARNPRIRQWSRIWFPDLLKTFLTQIFIGLSGLLWPLQSPETFWSVLLWLFDFQAGFFPSLILFLGETSLWLFRILASSLDLL